MVTEKGRVYYMCCVCKNFTDTPSWACTERENGDVQKMMICEHCLDSQKDAVELIAEVVNNMEDK